jgi:hexulose-6-phosphate isomerase
MTRQLKKGYMLSSFPGSELPILEKFKMLKTAGFEGAEIPSHLDQEEVLRARDKTGLLIPTVASGKVSRPLSDPDPTKRANAVEGVKQALSDAKRYGASSVLLVPGGVTETISYADAYQRNQTELRKVVPFAEKIGVKLAVENVWNNFILSPMEAVRFVDEFKSPAVAWHFDIGNVMYFGWPEQWIHALGKRIHKLHVKEYSRKKMNEHGLRAGFAVEYLEGDNDWPTVMKALDEVGYAGWASAEPAWRPPNVQPQERLQQISEKLDKIFAI